MAEADEAKKFVQKIIEQYSDLRLKEGKKWAFRPPRTIIYEKMGIDCRLNEYKMLLLHELGHALLRHRNFRTDAERVKMERAAWEKARELSKKYNAEYDEELVEERMDTYRDWLHQKSLCPQCGLTRYQTVDGEYHCSFCEEYKG